MDSPSFDPTQFKPGQCQSWDSDALVWKTWRESIKTAAAGQLSSPNVSQAKGYRIWL